MNSRSRLPLIAETLLITIEKKLSLIEEERTLSDQDILSLHSIFGGVLERAFDILEKQAILVAYRTPNSARVLIEVKGESDRCYRLFPAINFCPCQAFRRQVTEKRNQITCKHVLAARVASMTDKLNYQEINQEQYLMLVQSMFECEEH